VNTAVLPPDVDLPALGARLLIDLAALAALAVGLYHRRHGRRDLVTVYVAFNVGVFVVVTAIGLGSVALAVGFGLFAVLAMIRLRSEPYSHVEFAYFFLALVIALAAGVDLRNLGLTAGLCLLAVGTAWIVDRPGLLPADRRTEVTLELVIADRRVLLAHLEERLAARVIDATVLEVDYVRETTRVSVVHRDGAGAPAPVPDPFAVGGNGRDR